MEKENKSVFAAAGDPEEVLPNREYKDTVFRMLFNNKENLLSLYNALNGTNYSDTSQLEIVTLENAIYMNMKNDLAFIFMNQLSLYGHQSTFNPNLPLRGLFYIASEYEKLVHTKTHTLYSSTLFTVPTPKFIVFYNGEANQPEQRVLKLSDAYQTPEKTPCLELLVTVLNINQNQNKDLMLHCQTLKEYMLYVNRVRQYSKNTDIRTAVNRAVNECIKEGILKDFLLKNKSEVIRMSIFEYDEERELQLIRRDERQIGFEYGAEQRSISIAKTMLTNQEPLKKIEEYTGLSKEHILKINGDMLPQDNNEGIYKSILEYNEERELQLIRREERQIGFEQGIEHRSISFAKIMLLEQEPIDKIEKYTGLSREAILQLAETKKE